MLNVLPAHAGMIPEEAAVAALGAGAPRARGDDPGIHAAVASL